MKTLVIQAASMSCFKNNLKILRTDGNQVPQHYLCGQPYTRESEITVAIWIMTHIIIKSLDPYCNCGNEIEDAEHFFFNCTKFIDKRILLFKMYLNKEPPPLNFLTLTNFLKEILIWLPKKTPLPKTISKTLDDLLTHKWLYITLII